MLPGQHRAALGHVEGAIVEAREFILRRGVVIEADHALRLALDALHLGRLQREDLLLARERRVDDRLQPQLDALEHVAHVPLFEGGPVSRNQIIVASLAWDDEADACRFEPLEKPEGEFSLEAGHHDNLRVFLGYAGWSKNQLEREIALNSWLVIRPHPELLRADADDTTWRRIMNGLGPMYRVLADAPTDASQN